MNKNVKQSQKTLLASMVLSAFAPLATGIAVILSSSVTQMADFVRRTVEFLVLLLSWLVFRTISNQEDLTAEKQRKLEKVVQYSVAGALGLSGLVMLSLAIFFKQDHQPGGNVIFGLIISILGFGVNSFFWRRYRLLAEKGAGAIIEAQQRLYLAKLLVDLAVIVALTTVAIWPLHSVTKSVDILGSAVVSLYLLWTALRTVREQRALELSG